ncbi:Sensor histidine kinase LiaS [Streptococcus parauberis]|nr:Sensor histidine kinase LiaS [Streptococcus parauberis]KYP19976.1 Sensor histidine kinase LiaS [Streptococcus parauberis]KYP22705.1 Sensor histidine kinase LiaS [Streptococcus parauberis]KYP24137.1 Sensor histidine kinase LiaS [Streptococcus parauberis]KYP25203.1 Sensor histidine kinase LiaS [Streptococcus parauberis]
MMGKSKYIKVSKFLLLFINFVAVIFYSLVYKFSTEYITIQGNSRSLLEELTTLNTNPTVILYLSLFLFFVLVLLIFYRDYIKPQNDIQILDIWIICELIVSFGLLFSLQFSYNGFLLLVFSNVFYHSNDMYDLLDKKYWLFFLVLSFGLLLITDNSVLSTFVRLPDINVYISYLPYYLRISLIFVKNFINSLNITVFITSLISYIIYSITEKHKLEEEFRMVSRVNGELNDYIAITEKVAVDRERKRISREIHDTLGHALTGISAGIDAVKVLIEIDSNKAKSQLNIVSDVVREGIVDVRRSLNKLRPDALEGRTLEDALNKIIREFEGVSNIKIKLNYNWTTADLSVAVEDIIFRIIQESITNSLRHGHASEVIIDMVEDADYMMFIKDNGIGAEEIVYGYGLMQMQERLAIIGGEITFNTKNGFETVIRIPKKIRGSNDKSYDS